MPTTKMHTRSLIERLTKRRDEIEAEYAEARASVEEELARRKNEKDSSEAWAEWHEAMAKGFRDGTIEINDRGTAKRAEGAPPLPPRPGSQARSTGSMRGRGKNKEMRWYSDDQLRQRMESWVPALAEEIAPINAAIDLLGIAAEDTIEVDLDTYAPLLVPKTAYRRKFF